MSNIFRKIRLKIADRLLSNRLKTDRDKEFKPLSAMQSALIIIDITNQEDDKTLKEIKSELKRCCKNATIKLLCYFDTKKRGGNTTLISDGNTEYFNNNDLTFFYTPKNRAIDKILKKHYDISIALINDKDSPLLLLSRFVNSSFRAGKKELNDEQFDLMIRTDNNDSISFLGKQLIYYLEMFGDNKN